MNQLVQFGAEQTTGGIGALGLNVQGFFFQLITFVLVLLLLQKFVYSRLVDTLETRRKAVIDSLDNAKEAAVELEKASEKTAELLKQARKDASEITGLAEKEANKVIEAAEEKANKKAAHILDQANARIESEIDSAKKSLQNEMVLLVTAATERVIDQKLDAKGDARLIQKSLEEVR